MAADPDNGSYLDTYALVLFLKHDYKKRWNSLRKPPSIAIPTLATPNFGSTMATSCLCSENRRRLWRNGKTL